MAEIFSNHLNLEIKTYDYFRELNRDKGKFGTNDTYLANVRKTVSNRNRTYDNWDTTQNTLKRIINGVNKINTLYHKKVILIVSHGIIINFYFANLKGELNQTYNY